MLAFWFVSVLGMLPDDPRSFPFSEFEIAAEPSSSDGAWTAVTFGAPAPTDFTEARLRCSLDEVGDGGNWVLSLGTTAPCDATVNGKLVHRVVDDWDGPPQLAAGSMFSVPTSHLQVGENVVSLTFAEAAEARSLSNAVVVLLDPTLGARLRARLAAPLGGLEATNLEILTARAADAGGITRIALRDENDEAAAFQLHAVIDFWVREVGDESNEPIHLDSLETFRSFGEMPFVQGTAQQPGYSGIQLRSLAFASHSTDGGRLGRVPALFGEWSQPRDQGSSKTLELGVLVFPMHGGALSWHEDADGNALLSNRRFGLWLQRGKPLGSGSSLHGARARLEKSGRAETVAGPSVRYVGLALAGPAAELLPLGRDARGMELDETATRLARARTLAGRVAKLRPDAHDFTAMLPVVPNSEAGNFEREVSGNVVARTLATTTRHRNHYQFRESHDPGGLWSGQVSSVLFPDLEWLALKQALAAAEASADPSWNAALVLRACRHARWARPENFVTEFSIPLGEALGRVTAIDASASFHDRVLAAAAFTQTARVLQALGDHEAQIAPIATAAQERTADLLDAPSEAWDLSTELGWETSIAALEWLELPPDLHERLLTSLESALLESPPSCERRSVRALETLLRGCRLEDPVLQRFRDCAAIAATEPWAPSVSSAYFDLLLFGAGGVSRQDDGKYEVLVRIDPEEPFRVQVPLPQGVVIVRCHKPNVRFQRQLTVHNHGSDPLDLLIGFPSRLGPDRLQIGDVTFSVYELLCGPERPTNKTVR